VKFDKYVTADGLSQDEFVRFGLLWGQFHAASEAGETEPELLFMVNCLERMLDAKDEQLAEVYEELYQMATAKKEVVK
jgi:hypothetical protein